MSFFATPENVHLVNFLHHDPITNLLVLPSWSYDLNTDQDYVNDDPKYQAKVIKHVRTRLKEKWLYSDASFRKLLRYFDAKKEGDKCTVKMITNPDKLNTSVLDKDLRRCIFRYIEKLFLSKKFVSKTLRRYVKTRRIKWYDLFSNSDALKHLFAKKLEKQILTCMYNMTDN